MKRYKTQGTSYKIKCLAFSIISIICLCLCFVANGEQQTLSEIKPTLDCVATAHLDTQWRWTIQDTINDYIPSTLRNNFALFEKFPDYTFSFEGAFRYMLAKEYYPAEYAKLKQYISQNRWAVAGSSVDAGDPNIPSPESMLRHILYGNGFFNKEFDKESCDIFLPDSFGFSYVLPSIAAHCGLKGFSTQKLGWGSAIPIPFDIGVWEGPDGKSVVAALNPGGYTSKIETDLSYDKGWLERINKLGNQSGVYIGYKYFGVGDKGGAPGEKTVDWLEKSIHGSGPIRVESVSSDQLYRDLTPEQIARLPRYKGELLLKTHGVGCYSSHAEMKRFNRKNELLANAAERAAIVADWLGGVTYPQEKLTEAWIRFLWHQFHDDLTGTSIPQAYVFSWNDELISQNQFDAVLTDSVGAVAYSLDARGLGAPLVVYNALSIEREDVVEARVHFAPGSQKSVKVFDSNNKEVPAQVIHKQVGESHRDNYFDILFLAKVPSVGFTTYDVRLVDKENSYPTELRISHRTPEYFYNPKNPDGTAIIRFIPTIENKRYRIKLDENGDIASIWDKRNRKELLKSPIRLEMKDDTPERYPAWEIRYNDVVSPAREYVSSPAQLRITEFGPVRIAVEITREKAGSRFIQELRLSAGDAGNRIEFDTKIDWKTTNTLLKAAFPLTVSNPVAVYDIGLGTIERGNDTPNKYEVPAQQWAEIMSPEAQYGIAILNDCKYGWDKPNDNTLRLTLIHAPNVKNQMGYRDQARMDFGRHQLQYAIYGHKGSWQNANVFWQAARLNQPLLAFQTQRTPIRTFECPRLFSFLKVSSPQVAITAIKKAEESNETIVRVQETTGKLIDHVELTMPEYPNFPGKITSAREVTGAEKPLNQVNLINGKLVFGMAPYQLRTFALQRTPAKVKIRTVITQPVPLSFNLDAVSFDTEKSSGDLDEKGHTIPGELFSPALTCEGIPFELGPATPGSMNALVCDGQTIELPKPTNRVPGDYRYIYLLAAAINGDTKATFLVDNEPVDLTIQDYTGQIGQWYSRVSNGKYVDTDQPKPAFVKPASIAWVGTHRHSANSVNEPYVFCYLFKYRIGIVSGAKTLTLPKNNRLRIFAMTIAADNKAKTNSAAIPEEQEISLQFEPTSETFVDEITVSITVNRPDPEVEIRYTLDGSEPTLSSLKYTNPIILTNTTTIKAKAFEQGKSGPYVAIATYTKETLRNSDNPTQLLPGLNYSYYEGKWEQLPDFNTLPAVASGTTSNFELGLQKQNEDFGFKFTGYINIPRDGMYTFYTSSDDGSKLYIGTTEVVSNDGLHGNEENSGTLALKAGKHAVTVTYFQGPADAALKVSYEGPGIPKQPIPSTALYHNK